MHKAGIAVLMSILFSTFAFAQNNRSAVSLTGIDAASCTVPDPCRTFDVAISKTNAGGEVIVLSSAGYGPFTVTKSVSIISPPAYHAAIAPSSGDAITVSVDNAVVVLRGLTLSGSFGGINGITFASQSGSPSNSNLYVENCVISGFSANGVAFARTGKLFIADTTVRQSGNDGIFVGGSPGNQSWASIDRVRLEVNSDGLVVDNAVVAVRDTIAAANVTRGFYAVASTDGTHLSCNNCQVTQSPFGFLAGTGAGTARLTVSNSVVWGNADGIEAASNGIVTASSNMVTRNNNGLVQSGTGVFASSGNNTVHDNVFADTVGSITTFSTM